jgi:hypothetical protein
MHDLSIWIWITKTIELHAQVIHYVKEHMKDYTLTSTYYHIHPNKRLYTKEPKEKTKL